MVKAEDLPENAVENGFWTEFQNGTALELIKIAFEPNYKTEQRLNWRKNLFEPNFKTEQSLNWKKIDVLRQESFLTQDVIHLSKWRKGIRFQTTSIIMPASVIMFLLKIRQKMYLKVSRCWAIKITFREPP